jgi:hypothetical protein
MDGWSAVPRIVVGAIGGYLLIGGADHYRRALLLAGFAAGAGLATSALARLAVDGPVAWAIAFVAGALAALLFSVAERIAVSLLGAAIFATIGTLVAPFVTHVQPWIVPAVAGVLGLFVMHPIYNAALPVVSAAGGSLLVAWSLGRLHDPRVLIVCALVGLVVPWLRRRRDS